jgi:hypothetical protein
MAHPADFDRLDRGFALFDDLYEPFRRRALIPPVHEPRPGLGRRPSKPTRRNV